MAPKDTPGILLPHSWADPDGDLFGHDAWVWTAENRQYFLAPKGPVLGTEAGFNGNVVTGVGRGSKWTATTNAGVSFSSDHQPIPHSNGHTVVVVAAPVSSGAIKYAFGQIQGTPAKQNALAGFNLSAVGSAASGRISLLAYDGTAIQSITATSGGIDGKVHCWVLANDADQGYIYKDGLALTLTTNQRLTANNWGASSLSAIGNNSSTTSTVAMTDTLLLVAVIPRVISPARAAYISRVLSQGLAPAFRKRVVFAAAAVGAASHATTGALTGQGATVAGTAAHIAKHAASGALAGQGATVSGVAARTRAHATSGVLAGPGAVVAGVASSATTRPSSGALAGAGAAVVGAAARTRQHATTGVISGQGSAVAGVAARTHEHATSGAVAGPGAAISGAATLTKTHATTGVIAGPGAVLDGAAARTRVHATDGAIAGPGAAVTGDAVRSAGALTHATSGAITGQSATVAGTAARTRAHATSGAIAGLTASVSGTAAVVRTHGTSGAIAGPGAAVAGVAARTGAAVSHATSGALVGSGASITGAAARPSQLVNVARPSRPRPRPKPVETTDQTTVIALLMAAIEECEI